MTRDREIQIRKMALSKGIWGVGVSEIKELEAKYGIKCERYSCGGCLYRFMAQVENKLSLTDFINGKQETE